MATICIAENSGGKGGVGGGAGASGQASAVATGAGAHGYGFPVIELTTGMTTQVDVQLTKDYNGEIPADLSNITSVVFKARPTMHSNADKTIMVSCDYTADGKVYLQFTPAHLNYNEGVWYAEFLCYSGDKLVQDYRAYLCIRKGMDGSSSGPHPITVMDVRLALMDTSAEMNTLLDDLEFSDMMILHAVERAIDEWEETPPRLERRFNATNFPFREHLLKGVVGYLLQSMMYRYMRNRMQYSASGLTFDKNDKGQIYLQLANMALQEWRGFIMTMKTSMNMEECMGVVDQPWFGNDGAW